MPLLSSRSIRLRRQGTYDAHPVLQRGSRQRYRQYRLKTLSMAYASAELVIKVIGALASEKCPLAPSYVHLDVIIIPPKERWSRLQNAVPAPVKVVMNPCTQSEINRA